MLATKFLGPMGEAPNQGGISRRWIMQEVESSLRRLRHRLDRPLPGAPLRPGTDLEETLGALDDLVRQGKVRYIGSSTFPASTIVEAQWVSRERGLQRYVSEQPPYSMLVRGIEADVLPTAQRYGMAVIPWSPLSGGWLTGRYRKGADIAEPTSAARRRLADRYDLTLPANQAKLEAADQLAQLAEEAGIPLVQLAIAWVARHPAITSPIIGPRTMEQLEGQLAAADLVTRRRAAGPDRRDRPAGREHQPGRRRLAEPGAGGVGAAAVGRRQPRSATRARLPTRTRHERPVAHPQRATPAARARRCRSRRPSRPGAGVTRWRNHTGPTRQSHERPGSFAVMCAGTGTTPRSRTAPRAPGRTSRDPSPHAPRRCGAQLDQRAGSASSGQTCSAGARVLASYVSIGVLRPGRLPGSLALSHS